MVTLQTLVIHHTFPNPLLHLIVALLTDIDDIIRYQAPRTLENLATQQSFSPDFLEPLADPGDPCIGNRHLASRALADQSCLPQDTLQAMVVRGLKERDVGIRWATLSLIRWLPNTTTGTRGPIGDLLGDRLNPVTQDLFKALTTHGVLSDDIYRAIVRAMYSGGEIGRSVVELLGSCSTLCD